MAQNRDMKGDNMAKKRAAYMKTDQATMQHRVDVCAALMVKGRTTSTILAHPEISSWKMSQGTIRSYIHKARAQIYELGDFDRQEQFSLAIARLNHLWNMALKQENIGAARAVVLDLCKLYGIDGPIRVHVEGNVTINSFAELALQAARAAEDVVDIV